MTWAMMVVLPLDGSEVARDVSVIVEPEGASRGTFWQPGTESASATRAAPAGTFRLRVIIEIA
jgi:hypothetical protein